jgi:DNA-binding transcriptional ArsR family regulator
MVEMREELDGDIFQMLSHPYRKQILRLVSERPMMYTELMEALGIESGKLRFHLEKVRPLLAQDKHKKYILSDHGKRAIEFLENAESLGAPHLERRYNNPVIAVVFLVIGVIGGALAVGYLTPDTGFVLANATQDNTTQENLEKPKVRFYPEFEIGVYGVPEELAPNQTQRARIVVKNIGNVTIHDLRLRISVAPKENFELSDFEGDGINVIEGPNRILVNLGTLYTNPGDTKEFEFRMKISDSEDSYTLEVDTYFYPRNEWVRAYKKEINRHIIIR